ncbi:hypothetical protein J7E91_28865 [Streptomyces sp. ISL-99]|nr:hypothetical protein [Streptomyces sp. ISL-99]
MSGDAEAEVRAAAANLVAAFGAHDTDRYFAAFAEDATFLFPAEHAAGEEEELRERETVVLRCAPDGRWLVIHEHLSPEP